MHGGLLITFVISSRPSAQSAHREETPRRAPLHEAGEQYRLATGEWIVWVSPRCFIVSGVPPIGLPDVVALPGHLK